MRYLLLLMACTLTGCRATKLPDTVPPLYVPPTLGKAPYQNIQLYSYEKRWVLPDRYVAVEVPVTRPGRLEPQYTKEQDYFVKDGDGYRAVKVVAVVLEEYRKKELRRAEMLDDMVMVFLGVAAIGFLALIAAGFAWYYKQPFWDELMVGGVLLCCFGLAAAWWVDSLPWLAGGGVVVALGTMGYGIWSKRRAVAQRDDSLVEVATTCEQLKMVARDAWERVKPTVDHSTATEKFIAGVKSQVKEVAADRVADLVENVTAPVREYPKG